MESCLYEGFVHHERLQPVSHRFRYGMYMSYLDLQEIDALVKAGLLSASWYSPTCFWRGDHFGDPRQALADAVRHLVAEQAGIAVTGPIRLLTQLRTFGYYFSPLNLFFCFGGDGRTVEAVVAEVQNTPWRERHCYVLWHGNRAEGGPEGHYRHAKEFHVSPFMGMDVDYRWRLTAPAESLNVDIENSAATGVLFRACLRLRRKALVHSVQRSVLGRHPLMPLRITAAIYMQAFQLWRKKCPFCPHPKHLVPSRPTSRACDGRRRNHAAAISATV